MKVRVVKSGLDTYWYAGFIGNVYDVKPYDKSTYIVTAPIDESAGYYIDICDTVEVNKEEPKKVCNFKVDLSWVKGQAREVISEAIQKKLFEAGCKWSGGKNCVGVTRDYIFVVDDIITHTENKAKFDGLMDGNWYTKEQLAAIPEVSVNNALKGKFWTHSNAPKKEEAPKPKGYKVNLSMYKGRERETISKAVQEEAFRKGYRWGIASREVAHTNKAHLYFGTRDNSVCYDAREDDTYFFTQKFKELTVEEILSGALPQVK